jgi:ABC-type transporter Mla subunit MlaD
MQMTQTIFIIFTAVTSIGVLIQAGVLLGMYFAVKKTTDEARELSSQLKQHLVPTLSAARSVIEDVSPKIKIATANLVEASNTLRSQAEQINKTVTEVAGMAQTQVSRVDDMATAVLDGLTQATAAVQHGISSPLKQVSGVLHGLRAGFETFRSKKPSHHADEDASHFV